MAGNICSVKKEKVSVDRTDPELDLSYSAEESGYLDAVRYRDIRYLFADHRMIVTVSAKDLCSGIWKIRYIMEGEDGNRTEKTETFEPMEKSVCTFAVPFHGRDFKGTVMVEAWDWSGNHVSQDDGYIVESSKKHEETCRAQIETITEPGRTVGSFYYFQTDVRSLFRAAGSVLYRRQYGGCSEGLYGRRDCLPAFRGTDVRSFAQ